MKSFNGKVAAITGAASGMGRELALQLARQGCDLALSDVAEQGLEETALAARAHRVKVTTTRLDVSQRDAMYAWAEAVVRDHGRVNLIFNNAGVALSSTLESVSQKDFEWIMGINFWGVVYGSQAFLPHLKASGDGHIINTSSLFGLIAVPGVGPYNASKFAVRGYTEALRMELDMMNFGVSATCVHPGGIRTNIAKASRVDDSLKDLSGREAKESIDKFDKLLATTSAEKAASVILRSVMKNRRRVLIGPDAKFLDIVVRVFASLYQPVLAWASKRFM
jgi:NAD(P)-dependent dehydrogenase (short-subunit alcohol dehydrogenase family)